jgi:hypothetical protein
MNFCGLRRSLRVGYRDRDKELPLEKNFFRDTWGIMGSNN